MNISKLLAGAVVVAGLMPVAAVAQQFPGLYLGAGIGMNWPTDSDTTGVRAVELDYDQALIGAITTGWKFSNGFRMELESSFARNAVESANGANSSGRLQVGGINANVLYDFAPFLRVTPYAGLGFGYSSFSAKNMPLGAAGAAVSDSDWAPTAQAIAGVTYNLNQRWSVFGDYRYFVALSDPEFQTPTGITEVEHHDNRVLVGLRYSFGQPPRPAPAPAPAPVAAPAPAPAPASAPAPQAAPAPAPAPQVPRNYLVFFNFDRSDITPEASNIIRQAAANAKTARVTRIEATGHADRSGPENYNLRLSQRRAEAVRQSLMREGIPANEIFVSAKGESEPLVATPDGVREPQNRRVEIVLR
jgi:OOP family OmpA-OmpF porin